jgi:Fe-S cluster biogenesis protein NfuA
MDSEQVKDVIEKKVRPGLQMDGGDIELVDIDEHKGIVTVRLRGACAGCPMSQMTLTMGVEAILKREVEGFTKLIPAL